MSSPVQDLSVLHQRREQRLMLALAMPALLVILLLVVLPVGWLAWQSVYHNGFTLENYRRIWSEDIYWRSFALTFEISLLVTLLALLLGYPIAYAASVAPKRWGIIILALVVLPFWTSVLVRAYAWLALLQRTGVINQLLHIIAQVFHGWYHHRFTISPNRHFGSGRKLERSAKHVMRCPGHTQIIHHGFKLFRAPAVVTPFLAKCRFHFLVTEGRDLG